MAFDSIEKYLGKNHKYQTICGIDEAGRGPWAGPLVACALYLPPDTRVQGLDDSKKLTAAQREQLFQKLQQKATYGVGIINAEYIDQHGLSKAVNQAFLLALKNLEIALKSSSTQRHRSGDNTIPASCSTTSPTQTTPPILTPPAPITPAPITSALTNTPIPPASTAQTEPVTPDFLLIDGKDKLALPYPHKTIIKGDQKIKLIAAASIIAKVMRDHLMLEAAKKYPEYGFDEHMGYGTAQHQKALKLHGISPIHRKSYAPVHALYQTELF